LRGEGQFLEARTKTRILFPIIPFIHLRALPREMTKEVKMVKTDKTEQRQMLLRAAIALLDRRRKNPLR
jgi:hypothetical protein